MRFPSKLSMICAAGLTAATLLPGRLAADTLSPGTVAPSFTLPNQENQPVSLKDFKGKWVVLYFYPKDQTSGCSKEAHNFQRDEAKYKAANAVVLGVSLDTVESHKTWCTKDGFSFQMLADPEHKVVDAYGVPVNVRGPMSYANRDTFLISPAGKVVKEWDVKDIDAHSADVLATIESMKK